MIADENQDEKTQALLQKDSLMKAYYKKFSKLRKEYQKVFDLLRWVAESTKFGRCERCTKG